MPSTSTVVITSEERDDLMRLAFGGVVKKAAEDNSVKSESGSSDQSRDAWRDASIGSLSGALLGAGLGYLTHRTKPKDKDENLKRRMWTHILGGAGMGGLAGAGLGYFNVPGAVKDGVKSISKGIKGEDKKSNRLLWGKWGKWLTNQGPVSSTLGYGVGYGAGRGIGGIGSFADDAAGRFSRFNPFGTSSISFSDGTTVDKPFSPLKPSAIKGNYSSSRLSGMSRYQALKSAIKKSIGDTRSNLNTIREHTVELNPLHKAETRGAVIRDFSRLEDVVKKEILEEHKRVTRTKGSTHESFDKVPSGKQDTTYKPVEGRVAAARVLARSSEDIAKLYKIQHLYAGTSKYTGNGGIPEITDAYDFLASNHVKGFNTRTPGRALSPAEARMTIKTLRRLSSKASSVTTRLENAAINEASFGSKYFGSGKYGKLGRYGLGAAGAALGAIFGDWSGELPSAE